MIGKIYSRHGNYERNKGGGRYAGEKKNRSRIRKST